MCSFCEQYDYLRLTPPSRERRKTHKQNKSSYSKQYNKNKKFPKRFSNSYYTENKKIRKPIRKIHILELQTSSA